MITPDWNPTPRQLRQFAAAVLGVVLLLALGIWRRTGSLSSALITALLGALIALLGFLAPRAVQPLYRLLTIVTLPIGYLVSEILLRVVFYGVLTPLGLAFRMAGRDVLRLKRTQQKSYWQQAKQQKDTSGYFRQA